MNLKIVPQFDCQIINAPKNSHIENQEKRISLDKHKKRVVFSKNVLINSIKVVNIKQTKFCNLILNAASEICAKRTKLELIQSTLQTLGKHSEFAIPSPFGTL